MGLLSGLRLSILSRSLVFITIIAAAAALPAALQNFTFTAPQGSTNHGDPHLLCTLTPWTDIIVFFLGNYVAHAVTIKCNPGEPGFSVGAAILAAVLIPTAGIARGLRAILSFAVFSRTDLQKAARARALCIVARTEAWRPLPGDEVSDVVLGFKKPLVESSLAIDTASVSWFPGQWECDPDFDGPDLSAFAIHGSKSLPLGYRLRIIPEGADFTTTQTMNGSGGEEPDPIVIASNYSGMKQLLAIGQAIFAATTLFNTRGNQIELYGYAAFGLTVAPYAVMSIINLAGNLMCPDYPTLFLVDSSVMVEARRHGGHFEGVVGKLVEVSAYDQAEMTTSVDTAEWIQSVKFEQRDDGKYEIVSKLRLPNKQSEDISSLPISTSAKKPDIQLQPRNQDNEYTIPVVLDNSLAMGGPEPKAPERADHNYTLFIPSYPAFKRSLRDGKLTPRYDIASFGARTKLPRITGVSDRSGILAWIGALSPLIISSIPIAIIGGLTHFQPGSSTLTQRVWIMVWLCLGIVYGYVAGEFMRPGNFLENGLRELDFEAIDEVISTNNPIIEYTMGRSGYESVRDTSKHVMVEARRPSGFNLKINKWFVAIMKHPFGRLFVLSLIFASAFGVFVIVGQMLIEFGTCIHIP